MDLPGSASFAYDCYAPVYDACNAQNDYEMWLGEALLPELEKHGLSPGSALDLGCGTGRAFEPLLKRGWSLVGCDVSSGMLDIARRNFGSRVDLFNIDVRSLPTRRAWPDGRASAGFDLVLMLNDVLNYLIEDGDLEKVFARVRSNLKDPSGLFIFDADTLALFQAAFASGIAQELALRGLTWRGLSSQVAPGSIHTAELSGQNLKAHMHRLRHWTRDQVVGALEACDLRCLAALGQSEDRGRVHLSSSFGEQTVPKVIYIAGLAS